MIRTAHYKPPEEAPDAEYSFWLTTGRDLYHFHTRTKLRRSKRLNQAAPDAYCQISTVDAEKMGIKDGDMVKVSSRRGTVQVPAKVGNINRGTVFVPFHYGYFDSPDGRVRAANELTLVGWDPISKQPFLKYAAVKVEKCTTDNVEVMLHTTPRKTDAKDSPAADDTKKHPHVQNYVALLAAQLNVSTSDMMTCTVDIPTIANSSREWLR